MSDILAFINGYICLGGKLYERPLYVDLESGRIVDKPDVDVGDIVDLHGQVIAPAFLELQTNGCAGFHFTHLEDAEMYQQNLAMVSRYLVTTGVGSFWATIPTVSPANFKAVSVYGSRSASSIMALTNTMLILASFLEIVYNANLLYS